MPTIIGRGSLFLQAVFSDGLVSDAGSLSIDVGAFHYNIQGTIGKFNGAQNQSITDNAQNFVYVGSGGALALNTTGFPAAGDNVRLAIVTTSGGVITNIEDTRAFLTGVTAGGGGGEVNNGANVGAGAGVFKDKTGLILNFRSLVTLSNRISIALAGNNNEINFDVVTGNITHDNLGGLPGTDPHTQYTRADGTRPFTGPQSFGNQNIIGVKNATFQAEVVNGNSGASFTVNWTNGQKQRLTLNANSVLSFTAPPGACNLVLKLVQDGTGSRTVTWPASVRWRNATPPVLSTASSAIDIVAFYFDGTNYFGVASLGF